MKISNETKIGTLTAISITFLLLGYNFLKGKKLFEHSRIIYAKFKNVEGLENSDAVVINGLPIGTITSMSAADKDVKDILVMINLKKDVNIPKNSIASINTGLITSAVINITKGDATEFLTDGDTLQTVQKVGLLAKVQDNLDPIMKQLGGTLQSLDSLVQIVGSMFDPRTKNNFSALMANLATSSASLQMLLNQQSGTLAKSLNNVDSFTGNLAKNNAHITQTLDNLEKTSAALSNTKIKETVETLNSTMGELKTVLTKVNSNNGSLGLLINDKKLYQNLESTSRSLNILLDDFRVHPKRYVNISVFGRKDKSGPLTAPISDSSKSGN
ncbi:MAG: MCE family protein [Bacteroidetes bacterium]|nr:MCE family protein [Bacteroidota bacterium]